MTDDAKPAPAEQPKKSAFRTWVENNRTVAGALAGAAGGSVVPGVGTVIGAIVGAGIGFVSSHEKK